MDIFEIGMKFSTYKILMENINTYSERVKCKFWKRDARTIVTAKSGGFKKYLKPSLVYFDLKFSCIYGGMDFKSKSRHIRQRNPSLKCTNCPAYLRFKASEQGDALQLVAMNINHNHDLKLPKKVKRHKGNVGVSEATENFQQLKQMDNIEIQLQEMFTGENESSIKLEADDYYSIEEEDTVHEEINNFVPFTFRGLMAPAFTPFNNDLNNSINYSLIPEYAQYLETAGITGVLVNGTSGEGMCMTIEERKLVAEAWVLASKDSKQHVMLQIGGTCLPDVIKLAQHAEEIEVNSLLCLPELYFKPQSVSELISYLQIVGDAAPNTPLLYYHIPSLTNVNINMGDLLNAIGDKVPTFSGIKFTSTLLDEGTAAVLANNRKFAVFLGADTIMAGAYALGFDSAIATSLNIFPDHGKLILRLIKSGNVKEAQVVQEQLNSAISIITKNGTWVPTMKQAMKFFAPFQIGPPRSPLIGLSPAQILQMETELKKLSFVKN